MDALSHDLVDRYFEHNFYKMKLHQNILIAGGTGFLGRALQSYFKKKGHYVQILTRTPKRKNEILWDAKNPDDWILAVEWADVLINLTGKSVDCRYTKSNRQAIRESRIASTKLLRQAVQKVKDKPTVWLNASSATIYVHADKTQMTEDEGVIGDDFSMNVCKDWESEFFEETLNATRRVALRTGIVMGNNGGALPKMKQLTRWCMGGKQGDGQQFISWIHIDDFCRAVDFVIRHDEIVGATNIVAPQPIRNTDFMAELRTVLHKKWGLNQSKWFLELGARLIGTETELLLKSRNVIPERLRDCGFEFEYADAVSALKQLTNKTTNQPVLSHAQ